MGTLLKSLMFSQFLSKAFKMVLPFSQYSETSTAQRLHFTMEEAVFCAVLKPPNQLEATGRPNETPETKKLFAPAGGDPTDLSSS